MPILPNFGNKDTRTATVVYDPRVATSLIGALTALFTGYLGGKLPVTREQFVDYCVDMLMSRVPSHR